MRHPIDARSSGGLKLNSAKRPRAKINGSKLGEVLFQEKAVSLTLYIFLSAAHINSIVIETFIATF